MVSSSRASAALLLTVLSCQCLVFCLPHLFVPIATPAGESERSFVFSLPRACWPSILNHILPLSTPEKSSAKVFRTRPTLATTASLTIIDVPSPPSPTVRGANTRSSNPKSIRFSALCALLPHNSRHSTKEANSTSLGPRARARHPRTQRLGGNSLLRRMITRAHTSVEAMQIPQLIHRRIRHSVRTRVGNSRLCCAGRTHRWGPKNKRIRLPPRMGNWIATEHPRTISNLTQTCADRVISARCFQT